MRLVLFFLSFSSFLSSNFDHKYKYYNKVLSSYNHDGLVDYTALKKDPKYLQLFLKEVKEVKKEDYKNFSEKEKLCFLINLYNAACLKLIIDNYPVQSIREIGGWLRNPFRMDFIEVFSEKISLDDIEHKKLRKDFTEPRIHFALVCASISCPVLKDSAYSPQAIYEQLNHQTHIFLKDKTKNYLDESNNLLYLSEIFNWFEEDFLKSSSSVLEFVQAYLPKEAKKRLAKQKLRLRYKAYDWKLNEYKSKEISPRGK